MVKPFKTFDEQIEILKDRKLNFDDESYAKKVLAQSNYYNVVNGYKDIFLKRNLNGDLVTPEEYKEKAKFEELYSLYLMDGELKSVTFKYLLRFEKLLKTSCSYHFASQHRGPYSYLQMENYSKKDSDLDVVLSNLSSLSSIISSNKKRGKPAIKHYIENHNEVPIWILINFLTLGNVSYFYGAMSESLKSKIAKDFSVVYKESYGSTEKIGDKELKEIIKISNFFRNIAAHDEVMYSFKLRKGISKTIFEKYFDHPFHGDSFYDLIRVLKLVLPKTEHEELLTELEKIFNKYKKKFTSIKFEEIIGIAGFSLNWREF